MNARKNDPDICKRCEYYTFDAQSELCICDFTFQAWKPDNPPKTDIPCHFKEKKVRFDAGCRI